MSNSNIQPFLTRRGFMGTSAATVVCLSAGGASALEPTFRFMTPFSLSLAFAGVLYAEAKGYYADEGLAFEIEAAKGAAMAAQMVIAGQMDSARTGGTNYILSKVENSAPLISIATIAQLSPFYMISSTDNPAETLADLEGRTVGMASLGGSMEGTLDLLMRKGGLLPDKVQKVKVADSAASFALIEAGRAGAFIGNTSSMVKAMATGKGVYAFPMDDGMPGQVYVAEERDLAAYPEKYIAFLKATHRAALEIATTPEADLGEILEVVGSNHEVAGLSDVETAKRDLAANAANWIAKGEENLLRNVPEVWAGAVTMLHEAGMIGTAPDPTSLYTNDPLEAALKA